MSCSSKTRNNSQVARRSLSGGSLVARAPRRISSRERGASLIEVLTVMIILLVGIFIFIRIFPVGFASLQSSENRTLAGRLAQQQIEQIRSDAQNLPKSVRYVTFDATGRRKYVVNEDPDDLQANLFAGTNPNPYFSDVNKYRAIEGEAVKVPLPTAVGGVYAVGSVHTLKFGPIYMTANVGDPESIPSPTDQAQQALYDEYLRVYGAPLAGREVNSDDGSNAAQYAGAFRTTQSYLIDYNDGDTPYILFPPSSRVRTYFISYTWEDGANGIITNEDKIPIVVPANSLAWIPVQRRTGANAYGAVTDMVERSDVVERSFERIAKSSNFDPNEPYQYKLLSANIAAAAGRTSYANIGTIAFNPVGANYSERTPFGQRAFTAYLDYAVLDWHIIREDREVGTTSGLAVTLPNGTPAYPVRTTLPHIKQIGETEPDDTLYTGLYRDANNQVDIQVFDLQGVGVFSQADPVNNLGVALRGGDWNGGNPNDLNADYWIDVEGKTGTYASGRLYINGSRIPRGTQVRVLYKATGDWGISVTKADSLYRQQIENGSIAPYPAIEDPGDPNTSPPTPTLGAPDTFGRQGTRLYFHSTELNKSVVARFQYTRGTGASAEVVQTAPVQFTLDTLTTETVQGQSIKFATVDIDRFMPGRDTSQPWGVVGGTLQGVSVKTRVVWKDGDQTPVSDTRTLPNGSTYNTVIQRWRVQDVETFVTPAPLN